MQVLPRVFAASLLVVLVSKGYTDAHRQENMNFLQKNPATDTNDKVVSEELLDQLWKQKMTNVTVGSSCTIT